MHSNGKRTSFNPAATFASLVSKREKLKQELQNIEKQVYELETSYLQESSHFGNALKGFDGVLSSSKNTSNLKRSRKFQPEDRIFSLSSVTSPLADEHGIGKDDAKSDLGQVRSKGGSGGVASIGQGKPKKGRTGQREGKKIRLGNGLDLEEEDDPDSSLR